MDSERFDAWTRGLSSRRAALSALGGLGFWGLLGHADADAKRKKKKKKKKKKNCKSDTKKCGKKCIPTTQCCGDCVAGQQCCDGSCISNAECCGGCGGGQPCCSGVCSDLVTDGGNCGICGRACNTGACLDGTCTCVVADDCPGCSCAPRRQGGKACALALLGSEPCVDDGDCPELGSFCAISALNEDNSFCTQPCQG